MSCTALSVVLVAAWGASGAGLTGMTVLWLRWCRPAARLLVALLATTIAALTIGVIVLLVPRRLPDVAVGVLVVCVHGLVALAVASLFGRPASGAAERRSPALARELATTSGALAEARKRQHAAEAARRQLVTWFSHDFRTPLARLRAIVGSAQGGVLVDPPGYLARIRDDVHVLTALVDDMFDLSRIQAGALHPRPAEVALDDLVSDAVAELDSAAEEHGVRLWAGRVESVVVPVDHKLLARAVRELLANAIRYGGGAVSVDTRVETVSDTRRCAVVSIIDACGGIPEHQLDSVFEVGWRGEQAREGEGGGLGLAIVHGIVAAHEGEVAVRNVDGGCRFEVRLPIPTNAE